MLLDNEREVAGSSSALDRALKLGNRSVWCLERAILEFIHVGGPGGYRDLRELSDRFENRVAADDKTTAQISAWRSRQKLDHESEPFANEQSLFLTNSFLGMTTRSSIS